MENRTLKIVCGFQNEASSILREELKAAALQKGYDIVCISRYRKEGILQYLSEHKDFSIVVLQESLQPFSPFTAEDLANLTDERNINIIASISHNHYGNHFMKILYAAGITNAVFEEDAYAANIMHLILHGRSRRECRKYYGIEAVSDIEKALDIIDENRVKTFLDYIENGGPVEEIEKRYIFVASKLKVVENIYLVRQMPSGITNLLVQNKEFQNIKALEENKRKTIFSIIGEKISMMKNKKKGEEYSATSKEQEEYLLSTDYSTSKDKSASEDINNKLKVLKSDDISGLLEHAEELEVPVMGNENNTYPSADICLPAPNVSKDHYETLGGGRNVPSVREEYASHKNEKFFIWMMAGMFFLTIFTIVLCMCLLLWFRSPETLQPQFYEQTEQKNNIKATVGQEVESETSKNIEQEERETSNASLVTQEETQNENKEEVITEQQTEEPYLEHQEEIKTQKKKVKNKEDKSRATK